MLPDDYPFAEPTQPEQDPVTMIDESDLDPRVRAFFDELRDEAFAGETPRPSADVAGYVDVAETVTAALIPPPIPSSHAVPGSDRRSLRIPVLVGAVAASLVVVAGLIAVITRADDSVVVGPALAEIDAVDAPDTEPATSSTPTPTSTTTAPATTAAAPAIDPGPADDPPESPQPALPFSFAELWPEVESAIRTCEDRMAEVQPGDDPTGASEELRAALEECHAAIADAFDDSWFERIEPELDPWFDNIHPRIEQWFDELDHDELWPSIDELMRDIEPELDRWLEELERDLDDWSLRFDDRLGRHIPSDPEPASV